MMYFEGGIRENTKMPIHNNKNRHWDMAMENQQYSMVSESRTSYFSLHQARNLLCHLYV